MGIYIPGMDMPNDGRPRKALFTLKDGAPVVIVETAKSYDDKHIDVHPIVPVPEPHGRLGDLDALKKQSYPFPCAIGVERAVPIRAINDAPTIIPADHSGDLTEMVPKECER